MERLWRRREVAPSPLMDSVVEEETSQGVWTLKDTRHPGGWGVGDARKSVSKHGHMSLS